MARSVSEPFRLAVNAPLAGAQAFATRRSQPGVVRWIGFDSPADLGTINLTRAVYPGPVKGCIQDIRGYSPVVDMTKSASGGGGGSLKFTVPANAAGTMSGDWWVNFSDDASVLFDEGQTFYIQWRQWFSQEAIASVGARGGNQQGFKQCHIIAGDSPAIGNTTSCDTTEIVLQHFVNEPLPIMYHACGVFTPFETGISTPWNQLNFNIQNARPNYCVRYTGRSYTSRLPPVGACFGYYPEEWMMFKVAVTLGPFGQVPGQNVYGWLNSRVRLWMARPGQPSEPVIDHRINLRSGGSAAAPRRKYGKLWLDTYYQGAHPHAEYSIWYDEIVVSRNDIADPV